MILDIKLWTNRITGEISRTIALDSEDLYIRLASEDVFLLLFVLIVAIHPRNRVGKLFGCSLCFLSRAELRKQRKLRFAARPVHRSQIRDARTFSTISPIFLVLGSGRHPRSVVSRSFVSHTFSHLVASSTWKTWSLFHKQLDFSPAVEPCLRLTDCEVDPDVLRRWRAESLHTILIPIYLFSWESNVFPPFGLCNDQNLVKLPGWCEEFLIWLKYTKPLRIAIEGPISEECQGLKVIMNVCVFVFLCFPVSPKAVFRRADAECVRRAAVRLQRGGADSAAASDGQSAERYVRRFRKGPNEILFRGAADGALTRSTSRRWWKCWLRISACGATIERAMLRTERCFRR